MNKEQDIFVHHYLTAEQCALRFAVSVRHFKYMVASGEMPPPVKFGRSSRWPVEVLLEFETEKMAACRHRAVPKSRNGKKRK